jgi:hypothetical protein
VAELTRLDVLQLGNDPHFYKVQSVVRVMRGDEEIWRVSLHNLSGAGAVTLVRAARDHVLIVPRTR